ncbi:Crp/Fnr family transcriptional regulator [Proteiniclasticum sp. C24MP]|uniref:Crp/Fnr family transcriptional regulator n=1 Tax=Proteiniclasticum sp. C24MP TaxID=3374101 RepID=UPI003754F651
MEKEENGKTCSAHGAMHHDHCISLVPIFNHLTEDQMIEISELTHAVEYKRGETIYRAQEPSDALYIVSRGKVKIYRMSESGKDQIQRILTPGEFTGELALFNEDLHDSYAEALEDVQICMVKREDMSLLLLKYPTIAMKVLSEFSKRLEASEKQATRFATEKVDTRIAMYIAETLDRYGEKDIVEIPMKRKDLASHLGTTPETISRKLLELEEAEIIKQLSGNRIHVLDLDALLLV